ncbi:MULTISPECIES: PIN domain-containing protein [Sphingobacterium]|uniref:PIN domain-containing protein n=1 Tax=Sphingobacterium TaxID=28453 RepID=UPI000DB5271B|nr:MULTISPECIES: PIN domain-containing protein [Sphingobacterium]PZU26007.1 MAG: hypothetical protein DI622_01840 [Chryseobacterium sp.]
MELQTRNLIIDTQYFVQNVFDFNRKELVTLRNLIESGSANLYLTDITIAEVRKQIREKLSLAYDKFDTGDTRYLKPLPEFKKILQSTRETFVEEVLTRFDEFLEKWQVKIIESNEVNFLHVHELYSNMKPPFSVAKKKEFPDAFALEAIRMWRDNNKESAYLISKDDDWQRYIKIHKTTVNEETASLLYLEDISTFIDDVIRKEDEFKDRVKLADNALKTHWNTIKENILKKLKMHGFESYGLEDEEIVDVYILDCRLLQSDILEVKDSKASYELELDIDLIVKFSAPDYESAYYDKENQEYLNLKNVDIFSKQWMLKDCVIDFTFNDKPKESFKILSLEFDQENFHVDFDDFIDIEEWRESLMVIVCGVHNGEFTTTGLGYMEFQNISKAKETFPELNIYSHSKNFTAAQGNKITDSLRFETWKAVEYYST